MDTHPSRDPRDTPDPRFPRTERAFNDGQDWAGIWAAEQITRRLASATPETKRLLKPAITQLEKAVERLCPAALQPTAAGVMTGYGPSFDGRDITIITASPRRCGVFQIPAWPEPKTELVAAIARSPSAIWHAAVRFIAEGNVEGILNLLVARFDARNLALLDEHAMEIRRAGHTPVVAMLAGSKKMPDGKIAGAGLVHMISLPPGLEVQLAEPEGAA